MMRDPKRIPELLRALERIWELNPDFRLGQIVVNAARPKDPCPQVFYKEDDEMHKGLIELEDIMTRAQNK